MESSTSPSDRSPDGSHLGQQSPLWPGPYHMCSWFNHHVCYPVQLQSEPNNSDLMLAPAIPV